MILKEYKLLFVTFGLIGVLILTFLIINIFSFAPHEEHYTEILLLGPEKMAENYPFAIKVGENYSIYVRVNNHLRSSAYFTLFVKFGNQTDYLPNTVAGTPSPLQPLYEFRFCREDDRDWESLLIFSVVNASFLDNQAVVHQFRVNGILFNVEKAADWNATTNLYSYQLFLELWIYEANSGSMKFSNQFVGLALNLSGKV